MPKLVLLDPKSLKIDETYQRESVSKFTISRIVNNYDECAFGCLHVGKRKDGSLWLVDGWHRQEAAKELGIKKVPCYVFDSLGRRHEARVFKRINKDRKSPSPLEIFKSKVTARDPEALKLKAIVEKHGFRISSTKTSNTIQCVTTLNKGTTEQVDRVLGIIRSCYSDAVTEPLLSALVLDMLIFLVKRAPEIDDQRLTEKIAPLGHSAWQALSINYANNSGNRSAIMAKGFLKEYYNKKLRNGKIEI